LPATTLLLRNPRETERLAGALAPHLRAGDLVGLIGDLGAGKSVFARALVRTRLAALGRDEPVPSPSYTLVQIYELGAVDLWHADLYRLADPADLRELGLVEALPAVVAVVEWADRLGPALPDRGLLLRFGFVAGEDEVRTLSMEAHGPGWEWIGAATGR
jgi:tRNA threonylcarbamoyladenosine biosynthesis protein TsaE